MAIRENEPKLSEVIKERDVYDKLSHLEEYLAFRHELEPNMYERIDIADRERIRKLTFERLHLS